MPTYKEFTACIVDSEGHPLPEFAVETKGNEVTCWIPSEAGKTFGVQWKDDVRSTDTRGTVLLDGTGRTSRGIQRRTGLNATRCDGIYTSSVTYQRFQFAPMELSDDDSLLYQSDALTQLGEIQLEIDRVVVLGHKAFHSSDVKLPSDGKVHERCKKLGGHRIKLVGEEKVAPTGVIQVKGIGGGPCVKFVFRYRPLDLLKAQGIAPYEKKSGQKRPPVQEPEHEANVKAEDPDLELVDDDEIEKLENRLKALREKKKAHNQPRPKKKVKIEPIGGFASGDFIDLT
ncbi:hypothetical protein PUNSTDRAFT_125812 [Punctularia strigosozonata HHB-11173 SS5]|uniref:uncharacterized protein n=1 Tax=Punctularia strigosozonata (strain HHB-11173) TaxID=741275 RepID=UPI0004417F65|nr:uncharacterized protein PUNSTDRAFT_125812 [Punctularia strigosozonata HHB-11173 SS5]EIN09712.1 hypothetical protein PUNSTDRAFT_125812 [Punctularia strigosozonata HHB-11173 SS5]